MDKNKGFTLLELMAVILMSGLIAGMVLPALGIARASSGSVNCMDNLRRLGVASIVYMEDFDGFMFHKADNRTNFWNYNLVKHGHTPGSERLGDEIFWCPDYKSQVDSGRRDSIMWVYTTYTFNTTNADSRDGHPDRTFGNPAIPGAGRDGQGLVNFWVNSRLIRNPSNYWMHTEGVRREDDASIIVFRHDSGRPGDHLWDAEARNGKGIHLRHEGETASMSFFDGHVESAGSLRLMRVDPVEFREGWVGRYEKKVF